MTTTNTIDPESSTDEPSDSELLAVDEPFEDFKPESWSMLKDTICLSSRCISIGLENTQEMLIYHDINLGRTTRSNKRQAECLEAEIKLMQDCLIKLKTPDGIPLG